MRLKDWEQRLSAYLAEASQRSLVYGSHDCALFGASAVLALTGVDYGAAFRGRYSTEMGAARALRQAGFETAEAIFDARLAVIPTSFARRGDIAIAEGNIGVCIGRLDLAGAGDEVFNVDSASFGSDAVFVPAVGVGFLRRARRDWSKAWRV